MNLGGEVFEGANVLDVRSREIRENSEHSLLVQLSREYDLFKTKLAVTVTYATSLRAPSRPSSSLRRLLTGGIAGPRPSLSLRLLSSTSPLRRAYFRIGATDAGLRLVSPEERYS